MLTKVPLEVPLKMLNQILKFYKLLGNPPGILDKLREFYKCDLAVS